MAPELGAVQVVAVVQADQPVLVQLAEVVGLAKGIVGELPVQCAFDRGCASAHLVAQTEGRKLRREFGAEQLIDVQLAFGLRVYPQNAARRQGKHCTRLSPATRLGSANRTTPI